MENTQMSCESSEANLVQDTLKHFNHCLCCQHDNSNTPPNFYLWFTCSNCACSSQMNLCGMCEIELKTENPSNLFSDIKNIAFLSRIKQIRGWIKYGYQWFCSKKECYDCCRDVMETDCEELCILTCDTCKEVFRIEKTNHTLEESYDVNNPYDTISFDCPWCDKSFWTCPACRPSIIVHHEDGYDVCKKCFEQFR